MGVCACVSDSTVARISSNGCDKCIWIFFMRVNGAAIAACRRLRGRRPGAATLLFASVVRCWSGSESKAGAHRSRTLALRPRFYVRRHHPAGPASASRRGDNRQRHWVGEETKERVLRGLDGFDIERGIDQPLVKLGNPIGQQGRGQRPNGRVRLATAAQVLG